MKKILLLLLVQTICHANIYDGNTDAISSPRDLSLNPMDIGQQDASQTTSVKNYILTNLSGQDRLRIFTTTSQMVLENTTLELDGTFTFSHGSIKVIGNCAINGSSDFNKFRFESHLIHIIEGSELRIGPGVNFEYAPTGSIATGIRFGNSASKLILEDATLTVSNRLGLNLAKGQLRIEGNSTVDNFFTENNVQYLDFNTSFTETALVLGNDSTSYGDCKLYITAGSKLKVKNAGMIYRNNGSGSFDASGGVLNVDKNGSFIVDSTANFNGSGVNLGSIKLSNNQLRGNFSGLTYFDRVDFGGSSAFFQFTHNWHPSSKYVAATGYNGGGGLQVPLYRVNETGVTQIQLTGVVGSYRYGVSFSPDGKYLYNSGNVSPEQIIYSFVNETLSLVDSMDTTITSGETAAFSPDGKYIVVTGYEASRKSVNLVHFDGSSIELIQEYVWDASDTRPGYAIWSHDGKYVILTEGYYSAAVKLLSFDSSIVASLAELDAINFVDASGRPHTCKFTLDNKYLAIVGETGSNQQVRIYNIDDNTLTEVCVADYYQSGDIARGCSWSPDGKYLAVSGDTGASVGNQVEIYSFDGSSLTSQGNWHYYSDDPTSGTNLANSIEWSPDGKYISVAGNPTTKNKQFEVYKVDYSVDDSKLATVKNATIKLNKDLTLRDINLKMK